MTSARHAWHRLGVHRYECTRCGLEKVTTEAAGEDGRLRYGVRFERSGLLVAEGKTPRCPGSRPPTSLSWERSAGGPWWDARETGHRVLAIRRGSGWAYMAYGPNLSAGWDYRAWSNGTAPHCSGAESREHYARGEHIPQPRAFLGVWESAQQAREACATHAAGDQPEALASAR